MEKNNNTTFVSQCDTVNNWRQKSDNKSQNTYSSFNKEKQYNHEDNRNRNYGDNRNRNYDRNYGDNRNRNYDRNYGNNRNRNYDKEYCDNSSIKPNTVQFTNEEFPELSFTNNDDTKTESKYLDICKKLKEENETKKPLIDVNDPKYWKQNKWVGPMMIKSGKHLTKQKEQFIYNDVMVPTNRTLYGRDGMNWFPSWKETFTDEQWNNMNYQIECEHAYNVINSLCNRYQQDLENAYHEYYEYGTMNTCLNSHIDLIESEIYADNIDKEYEMVSDPENESGNESDYSNN